MVRSYDRGHRTQFDADGAERYSDSGAIVDHKRACVRCKCLPTKDGHDACLGTLPNVAYACCGHGVEEKVVVYVDLPWKYGDGVCKEL